MAGELKKTMFVYERTLTGQINIEMISYPNEIKEALKLIEKIAEIEVPVKIVKVLDTVIVKVFEKGMDYVKCIEPTVVECNMRIKGKVEELRNRERHWQG